MSKMIKEFTSTNLVAIIVIVISVAGTWFINDHRLTQVEGSVGKLTLTIDNLSREIIGLQISYTNDRGNLQIGIGDVANEIKILEERLRNHIQMSTSKSE